MGALATASKVALFPGWFLWRAYLGLWWAFDDATILRMRRGSVRRGEGTVGPAPGADGAAKVSPIAARAREALAAPPRWLLVTGFLGTLATSASAGAVVGVANGGGGMAPDAAWLAWSIATLTAAMGTVLIIRAHHLRHRRRVARAIVGAMARGVRAGAGSVRSAVRQVGAAVANASSPPGSAAQPPTPGVASRRVWREKARHAMARAGSMAAGAASGARASWPRWRERLRQGRNTSVGVKAA